MYTVTNKGLWLCLVAVAAFPAELFAQTLTTDAPPEQKMIELLMKALGMATVGLAPWLTGKLTAGLASVPYPVRLFISSTLGSVLGAALGFIPEYPLGIESAAEMGGAGGLVGQWLAQKNPNLFTPKTVQSVGTDVKT